MTADDITNIEAAELLKTASKELLTLAALGKIDLNHLAHWELRSRRRQLGTAWVGAMARECQP